MVPDLQFEPSKSIGTTWGLQFSPTIELGHILQAIVMLVALGGWALTGYISVERQLDSQARVEQSHHSEVVTELALQKQRMDTDERALAVQSESLKILGTDIRSSFDKLSGQVSDLRPLIAQAAAQAATLAQENRRK